MKAFAEKLRERLSTEEIATLAAALSSGSEVA